MESAVGTSFPLRLVNMAVSFGDTGVHLLILYGSLEEALAGLTGEQSVVVPTHTVTTDGTRLFDGLLGIGVGRRAGHRDHGYI